MGAYDNPKIIQPVNYGEIFAKAALNTAASYNAYVKKEEQKRKEREAKIAASEKAVREFGEKALTITEGALGQSVFTAAEQMTRQFAILEQQKMSGEISGAEYNEGYMELFGNISKIKGVNTALAPVEEQLNSGDVSTFNPKSVKVIGLIDAKNRGALNVRVVAGETIYDYNDPEKGLVSISEKELAQADNVYINPKYDVAADIDSLTTLVNGYIEKDGSSRMVKNDDGSTNTITTERYKSGVPLEEEARNKFFQNLIENGTKSALNGMDIMDAGAVMNDNILPSANQEELLKGRAYTEALEIFKRVNGVDEVALKNLQESLTGSNPAVSDVVQNAKGEDVPLDSFIVPFVKKHLADEVLQSAGKLAQAKQQVVVDETTPKDEEKTTFKSGWTGSGNAKADSAAEYIVDGLLGRTGDKSAESFLQSQLGISKKGTQIPDPEDEDKTITVNQFKKETVKVNLDENNQEIPEGSDTPVAKVKTRKLITIVGSDGKEQTFDFNDKQQIKNLANILAGKTESNKTAVEKSIDEYLEFLRAKRLSPEKFN